MQTQESSLAIEVLSENPVLYDKIHKACNVNHDQVQELVCEVIRFLSLIGESRQRLTPSVIVDNAWHELILCTRYYHELCETQFGRYIHHHPGGEEKENKHQFLKTIQLYREKYGEPPVMYWGRIVEEIPTNADCGPCSAD